MVRPARKLIALAAAAALVLLTAGAADAHGVPGAPGNPLQPGARLFVNPHSTTVDAMHHLTGTARKDATRSVKLSSGDVVMFGGPARLAYHGIDRIYPGSSSLIPGGGRINLTLRRVTA